MGDVITSAQYAQILTHSALREETNRFAETPYLLVDHSALAVEPVVMPMLPVIGVKGQSEHPAIDVFATDDAQLNTLKHAIQRSPDTAATLVQLLRHNANANIIDGLFAESLAYSTLQQSTVFQAWLTDEAKPTSQSDQLAPVLVERIEDQLHITLNRPKVHNAYSTSMRDHLVQALYLADADPTIQAVKIAGNGPSFCAGGDLTEFGRVTDAAQAHLSRTTRSAGAVLSALACQTTVRVHGACIGAGIEVPAFAKHIAATEDAFFQLPEVSFGLVPGAGGTVSITKRIGRHRTAWLALSNARLSAHQALAWGLIDSIVDTT